VRRLLLRLAVFFASALIVLLALEAVFRAFGLYQPPVAKYFRLGSAKEFEPHPLYPEADPTQKIFNFFRYKPNSTWATQYPSNPRGYFGKKNQLWYRMNSEGFRDREFGPREPARLRIVTVGDSFVFGEGVKSGDCFQRVLERMLVKSDHSAEVLNLGVNGYDTRDEIVALGSHLERFDPDIVIWGYVLNDIHRPFFDAWPLLIKTLDRRRKIKTSSHLIRYVQDRLWRRFDSKRFVAAMIEMYEAEKYWKPTSDFLRQAHQMTEKKGGRFLMLLFPYIDQLSEQEAPFDPIYEKLVRLFDQEKIETVDLRPVFGKYAPSEISVHETDPHPNELGHRLVAEAIFQTLIAHPKYLKPEPGIEND
jgi:lysophospholipase L1-like esterase